MKVIVRTRQKHRDPQPATITHDDDRIRSLRLARPARYWERRRPAEAQEDGEGAAHARFRGGQTRASNGRSWLMCAVPAWRKGRVRPAMERRVVDAERPGRPHRRDQHRVADPPRGSPARR